MILSLTTKFIDFKPTCVYSIRSLFFIINERYFNITTFLQNIICSKVVSSSLHHHISFKVLARPTYNIAPFVVSFFTTDYQNNEALTHCMRQANFDISFAYSN